MLRPGDSFKDGASSSIVFSAPPGKVLEETVDVGRLYIIKEPGEYKLEVTRFETEDTSKVRSNELVLTVIP